MNYLQTEHNGQMLVFKLADKIKVVGTYHALNENDKKILEQLVNSSDFVACEDNRDIDVVPIPFAKGVRYDDALKMCLCGYLDLIYAEKFVRPMDKNIKKVNKLAFEMKGVMRNVNDRDFEFCEKIAAEKGKKFYFVDFTAEEKLRFILNQKRGDKMKQIFGLGRKELDSTTERINYEREKTMLERIEQHEGPINNLHRQGILVVGYGHAMNYLEGRHKPLS